MMAAKAVSQNRRPAAATPATSAPTTDANTGADQPAIEFRPRRGTELVLLLIAQTIGWGAYLLTSLNRDNSLPPDWLPVTILWYGLGLAVHFVVRWRARYADPVLLPATFCLVGLGQAALHRYALDFEPDQTPDFSLLAQEIAVGLGLVGFVALLIGLRDMRRLKGYPYLLSLGALILLLLPLVPGLGAEINGSRIWIYLGPFSLQPAEIAKLVLAASFAAYLTENRDLLAQAGRRVFGLRLTRVRDIAPLLLMWGVSLIIMMWERDLGTSLLFFGLIVMMLYVATAQLRWLGLAAILAGLGGLAAWRLFGHVQRRVDFWLHPEDFPNDATQILSSEFGMATGGLLGSGWGLGWPSLTPFYFNDMIAPSLAEEIGLAGLMGIIVIYGLIGFRGLKMALLARDNFTKLFAAGLSFGFLLQVFIIIGGSTRLLPLTGLTSPFLSQGGSSMIANWLLIGLLVIISHQVRRPADAPVDLATERTMTINVRQLRRIADGDVAPLLAVPADLVKETDVTVAVPAPTAASVGSSEPSGSSGSTSAPASDPASASVSPAAEPPDLTDADPTEIVVPDLDGRPFSASVSSPATPSKSINDDLTEVMVPDLNGRSAPAASPSPVVPTLSEDNATMTTEVSASDAGIDTETDTDTDDGTSADAEATTTLSPTSPPVPPEVRS